MADKKQRVFREGPTLSTSSQPTPGGERRVKVQHISVAVPCVTYLNVDKREFPVPNATVYQEELFRSAFTERLLVKLLCGG